MVYVRCILIKNLNQIYRKHVKGENDGQPHRIKISVNKLFTPLTVLCTYTIRSCCTKLVR